MIVIKAKEGGKNPAISLILKKSILFLQIKKRGGVSKEGRFKSHFHKKNTTSRQLLWNLLHITTVSALIKVPKNKNKKPQKAVTEFTILASVLSFHTSQWPTIWNSLFPCDCLKPNKAKLEISGKICKNWLTELTQIIVRYLDTGYFSLTLERYICNITSLAYTSVFHFYLKIHSTMKHVHKLFY